MVIYTKNSPLSLCPGDKSHLNCKFSYKFQYSVVPALTVQARFNVWACWQLSAQDLLRDQKS